MIPIAYAHTPEWKEARKTGIGASLAGAACGVSRFGSPRKVYELCTGGVDPDEDTIHTRFGKFMEPAIVAMYSDEIGKPITYPLPMCRSQRWPFMLATGDAQESPTEGVEIKTIDERYAAAIDVVKLGLEEACPDYFLQAQQQCAVMGWDVCTVVMLIGKKLHKFPVERDDEMIEIIAAHEADLWDKIVKRIPPAPTTPIDLDLFRRRKKTVGYVVPLTSSAAEKWQRYQQAGRLIRKLEQRRDMLKAEVLHEIGDAPAGLMPDGAHMIRRKLIKKEGHYVAPCEYMDSRLVKYDGSPLAAPQSLPAAS